MDEKTLKEMSDYELVVMQAALLEYPEDRRQRQEVLKEIGERQKKNEGGDLKWPKRK